MKRLTTISCYRNNFHSVSFQFLMQNAGLSVQLCISFRFLTSQCEPALVFFLNVTHLHAHYRNPLWLSLAFRKGIKNESHRIKSAVNGQLKDENHMRTTHEGNFLWNHFSREKLELLSEKLMILDSVQFPNLWKTSSIIGWPLHIEEEEIPKQSAKVIIISIYYVLFEPADVMKG